MSKVKTAFLISIALSPIVLNAVRGVEIVHADTTNSVVSHALLTKKTNKTLQKNSQTSETADSQKNSDNVIGFDDKNFQQKFEASDYYKKMKAKYGADVPKDDAAFATQTTAYIATIIGEKINLVLKSPVFAKLLGFAGPLGSFLAALCDLFSPKKQDETGRKLGELDAKVEALGIKMTNDSSAVGEKIDQATIGKKLDSFQQDRNNYSDKYYAEVSQKNLITQTQNGGATLNTSDPKALKEYYSNYGQLYSTETYGINSKGNIVAKKGPNFKPFQEFNTLSARIVNANVAGNGNDIFQMFADYESLKEFFNTGTFAARETFSEDIMSHYTIWAEQMRAAIVLDYLRVHEQINRIKDNYDIKATDFSTKHQIIKDLLSNFIGSAKVDLKNLGFDSIHHQDEYELQYYIDNDLVLESDPTESVTSEDFATLASNVKAVNYAYANTVNNDPVKTPVMDRYYKKNLAAAQKVADDADAEEQRTHYASPFNSMDWDKAREAQKAAHDALDKLTATNGVKYYEDEVAKDPNGKVLPGKLKAEEQVTKDAPVIYSYRNQSWVYNRLDSQLFGSNQAIPIWYATKYFVNKSGLDQLSSQIGEEKPKSPSSEYFGHDWENIKPLNNAAWNAALDHAAPEAFLSVLNDKAKIKGQEGINSLIERSKTHDVKWNVKDENGATIKSESLSVPGFNAGFNATRFITDKFNFDGSIASAPSKGSAYKLNPGYFEQDFYLEPSVDRTAFYRDCHLEVGCSIYTTNDESYDNTSVYLITVPKAGDTMLSKLNNGNHVPAAPELHVENDV